MLVGNARPVTINSITRHLKLKYEKRTFGDFCTLYNFVINGPSALLNKLVTFDAQIDNFGAFDAEFDELFRDLVDNVCRCLTSVQIECQGFFRLEVTVKLTLYLVRSASVDEAAFFSSTWTGAAVVFSVSDISRES